jgi:hypothetical protein
MVRSATIGGIAAVRLGDHRAARQLFALARGIAPDQARPWARWAVSCVPPLAARIWAVDATEEHDAEQPATEPPPVDTAAATPEPAK